MSDLFIGVCLGVVMCVVLAGLAVLAIWERAEEMDRRREQSYTTGSRKFSCSECGHELPRGEYLRCSNWVACMERSGTLMRMADK